MVLRKSSQSIEQAGEAAIAKLNARSREIAALTKTISETEFNQNTTRKNCRLSKRYPANFSG